MMLMIKKKSIEHIVNWDSVSDVCFFSETLYVTIMGDGENQIIVRNPKTEDGITVDSSLMVQAMVEKYLAWSVVEND